MTKEPKRLDESPGDESPKSLAESRGDESQKRLAQSQKRLAESRGDEIPKRLAESHGDESPKRLAESHGDESPKRIGVVPGSRGQESSVYTASFGDLCGGGAENLPVEIRDVIGSYLADEIYCYHRYHILVHFNVLISHSRKFPM